MSETPSYWAREIWGLFVIGCVVAVLAMLFGPLLAGCDQDRQWCEQHHAHDVAACVDQR